MKDKDFWADNKTTISNQLTNKKAIQNQQETIKLIDSIGGLKGDVLDMGERNALTWILEQKYAIRIDSTCGDLDEILMYPKEYYDLIHYNNVIEHQFNPLFTLQRIKEHLKPNGILILGTPLKPNWITSAKCHFHEMNEYEYYKLIARAGFYTIIEKRFYRQFNLNGIRGIIGSFYTRQIVSILKVK